MPQPCVARRHGVQLWLSATHDVISELQDHTRMTKSALGTGCSPSALACEVDPSPNEDTAMHRKQQGCAGTRHRLAYKPRHYLWW
jgi:hypothetical protein